MANTFELIASSTVGSGGASSIDFTSIPSTYTDLQLLISARNSGSDIYGSLIVTFNSSTTGYSKKLLQGSGSSAASYSNTSRESGQTDGNTATANTFSSVSLYIPNYAGSSYKSFSSDSVTETNATTIYAQLWAGLWSNTAAITTISLTTTDPSPASQNFLQYSTAYLYGVKNA